MQIYELPNELTPDGYNTGDGGYPEYERESLPSLNGYVDRLAAAGVVATFYWYSRGDYCGAGEFLMRLNNGKWLLQDGGHCSCYGPLESMDEYDLDVDFDATFDSLDVVLSRCSQDYQYQIKPLVDMAREKGFN